MKKTKEEAEKTKQAVIEAAVKIFNQKGYASTRLMDIADEAGITRGAIYWHFSSKPELFGFLVNMAMDKFTEVVVDSLHSDGQILDRVTKIFVTIQDIKKEIKNRFQFIDEILYKAEVPIELLPVVESLRRRIDRIQQLLHDEFDKAQRIGELSNQYAPENLTRVVMMLLRNAQECPVVPITDEQNRLFIHFVFAGLNSLKTT